MVDKRVHEDGETADPLTKRPRTDAAAAAAAAPAAPAAPRVSAEMLETFSRIFYGALSAAGESVSTAANPKAAVAQVEVAISFILAVMRALAENGVALPDPEDLIPVIEPT